MPAFLHFYQGFDRAAYRRLPRGEWIEMVQYMDRVMSGR